MRVTLKEVATKAQLSVSTTSRALNGHPAISEETTARVLRIASELSYHPVRSHRRIAGTTKGILAGRAIVIASVGLDRTLVSMPVISEVFRGAEKSLREAGATLQFMHMPDVARLPEDLRLERVDGLILTGAMVHEFASAANTPAMNRLMHLPVVWALGKPPGACGDAVMVDEFYVGWGAAEQLVAHGHQRLAFLNSVPDNLLFALREDGFYSAARRMGAEVRSFCRSSRSGWRLPLQSPTSAYDVLEALIDQLLACKPRPTAIFAAADSIAALAYCALGVRGLRVGHDISIIAGNNTPGLMPVPYPHLATFDIHAQRIGELAVRHLAIKIADQHRPLRSAPQVRAAECQVVVKPTFIPGESVCDIRKTVPISK